MASFYQLIDLDSGNVTSDFSDEQEARAFLRNASHRYGENVLGNYGLAKMNDAGTIEVALEGSQLMDWVKRDHRTASSAAV